MRLKIVTLLCVLFFYGCQDDVECSNDVPRFELSDDLKLWMPDSIGKNHFLFRANNGYEESFQQTSSGVIATRNDFDKNGCKTESEYSNYTFQSTFSNTELHLSLFSGRQGEQALSIDFMGFSVAYRFDKDLSLNVSLIGEDEQTSLLSNWSFMPSYSAADIEYKGVAKITLIVESGTVEEHTPKTVYYAQHYGIIAFEQFNGTKWELKLP